MIVLGSDMSPENGRSAYLSAWSLICDAGSSSGPLIVGWVSETIALPFAALVIAGAGLLAGSVFGFLVPDTLKQNLDNLVDGAP